MSDKRVDSDRQRKPRKQKGANVVGDPVWEAIHAARARSEAADKEVRQLRRQLIIAEGLAAQARKALHAAVYGPRREGPRDG